MLLLSLLLRRHDLLLLMHVHPRLLLFDYQSMEPAARDGLRMRQVMTSSLQVSQR